MFEFTAVHGEQPRNPAVNHGHGKQSEAAAGWAEFVLHRSQNRKAAAGEKIVASRARGKLHLQVEQTREIVTCGSMVLCEIVAFVLLRRVFRSYMEVLAGFAKLGDPPP